MGLQASPARLAASHNYCDASTWWRQDGRVCRFAAPFVELQRICRLGRVGRGSTNDDAHVLSSRWYLESLNVPRVPNSIQSDYRKSSRRIQLWLAGLACGGSYPSAIFWIGLRQQKNVCKTFPHYCYGGYARVGALGIDELVTNGCAGAAFRTPRLIR